MKPKRTPRRLNPDTVLLIRQIIIGVMVVSFVSLLVLSVWYGTRLETLTLRTVTVTGGETIATSTVSERAAATLEGAYLGLIPKRFAFLYPKEAVSAAVDEFERIKSFSVERVGTTELLITFIEYVPDALLCDDSDATCLFLDTTGFAFTTAPTLRGGAFLRFENIGVAPQVGVQVFTPDVYGRAKELVRILENQNWFIGRVEVDAAGDAYLSVIPSGELKVDLSDEPLSVVENLLTVLSAPEFTHIEPGTFEYIDLRFGNKVFVKEFTPEPEVEVTASSTDAVAELISDVASSTE